MQTPQKIGKYAILEEKGRGGFGVVYRALNPDTQQAVAVKVVTGAADSGALARFLQEARTTHGLRHPHIVAVYDADWDQGRPYIAMEFLEGMDLQECIKSGRSLSLLEKVQILSQVADALRFAHDHGVIHRDIKPANVMLLTDGSKVNVKVMDFGIARALRDGATRHTQEGFAAGTPEYMAPEQLRDSQDADRSTDVWAFGVLAYELLTGVHPFRRDSWQATMFRIVMVPDDPESIETYVRVPEELERTVMLAISRERDLRYQNLNELYLDLEPVLTRLKEERARELMADLRRRLSSLSGEEAMGVVMEALQFDPKNSEAQGVRREFENRRREQRRRRVVDEYRSRAEKLIADKAWIEAVELLQTACRTAPHDKTLAEMLKEAQAGLERINRANRLVSQSRMHLQSKQFDDALICLREADRFDPERSDVQRLLRSAEEERAQHLRSDQREHHLTEALRLASGPKPHAQQLREALVFLDQYAALGGSSPEVDECRRSVEAALQQTDDREEVTRGLDEASRIQAAGRTDETIAFLTELAKRFPGEAAITSALTTAEQRRAAELKAVRDAAERLEAQRRTAIQTALQQAESDRHRNGWTDGIKLLRDTLTAQGHDPTLASKLAELESEQAAYRQQLAAAVETVESRLRTQQWDAALQTIEDARQRFPELPNLDQWRRDAESGKATHQRESAKAALFEEIRSEENACRWVSALNGINLATQAYPEDSAELEAWRERIETAQRLEEAEAKFSAAVSRYDWQAARSVVDQVRTELGSNPAKPREKRLKEASEQHAKNMRALEKAISRLLDAEKFAEARRKLDEATEQWPNLPELPSLQQRIDNRERERQAAQANAEANKTQRDKPHFDKRIAIGALGLLLAGTGTAWYVLRPPSAALRRIEISTTPPGASVKVGDRTCVTPRCVLELPPGDYVVVADAPGYQRAERRIALDPKQSAASAPIEISMIRVPAIDGKGDGKTVRDVPPPPPPPTTSGKGTLLVSARVPDAAVYLDGKRIGTTDSRGYFQSALDERDYAIRVEKKGYIDSEPQKVTIARNQRREVAFNLTPQDAELVIRGGPSGATLILASTGKKLGEIGSDGSLATHIPPGPQVVEIRRDKFQPKRISLQAQPGQLVALTARDTELLPMPPTPPDPLTVAKEAWERVRSSEDVAELEEYRRKYPKSQNDADAANRIQSLLRERQAREAALALKKEWDGLDHNDLAQLEAFQATHRDSQYSEEAKVQIARLKAGRTSATDKQGRLDADRRAIHSTLKRFEAAYANRSVSEVQSVFPQLPKSAAADLGEVFRKRGFTIQVDLQTVGEPQINGDSASVLCDRTTVTKDHGRQLSDPLKQRVRMTFNRSGESWIISSIENVS